MQLGFATKSFAAHNTALALLPKTIGVGVTRTQVFDILWQETFWDWLLHGFLATHDPSRIMDIYSIFAHPNKDEGVVKVPLKAALLFHHLSTLIVFLVRLSIQV